MAEFSGQFHHGLDAKGRLTLPAPFREELGGDGRPMLAIGLNRCLAIYPAAEWAALLDRVKTQSRTDPQAVGFRRVLLSTAFPCEPDRQGRVVIPPSLRELAAIGREVAVVGNHEVIEIWDRARWGEYFRQRFEEYDVNAAKLSL